MRDISGWQTRLDKEMITHFVGAGAWTGVTLADVARDQLRENGEKIAVVDGAHSLTFKDLYFRASSLASALVDAGLRPGDVVSFQLPNWHEATVINLAACLGGFVVNPIVPIYRAAEVSFILADSRSKMIFVPECFRGIDYGAMLAGLRSDLPNLAHVVAVRSGSPGSQTYQAMLERGARGAFEFDVDPDAVKLLLYTSGTTGRPKGVLHSHNTLRAEIDAVIKFWKLSDEDTVLMPSPVTHITGYLYALELPFATGLKAVLMDQWNADNAMRLIEEHRATFSIGATPFLAELVAAAESRERPVRSLRLFACGGAPVPPEIVARARTALPNCITCRVFGSSEAPTVSLGVNSLGDLDRGGTTDGLVVNHEVRVVDPSTGENCPAGRPGEIVTRGPEVMLGYTDPEATAAAFDRDGFFHTGDLGFLTADGYLTISGRKKDLIIRGGENISPKEIEDALHEHPAVLEAAVVAMPHPRMGETPAVYLVLKEGATLNLETMTKFLEAKGLAKQKFPERLIIVGDLPKTASGKVLKHVLRERIAAEIGVLCGQDRATDLAPAHRQRRC